MASDKFGITHLRNLTQHRLASWLRCNSRKEQFPQVVRVIMQSIPPQELLLPEVITGLISENAGELLKRQSILDLLEEFPSLAVSAFKDFVQISDAERIRRSAVCDEAVRYGRRLKSKINNTERCRQCDQFFGIRAHESRHAIVICKFCDTRH